MPLHVINWWYTYPVSCKLVTVESGLPGYKCEVLYWTFPLQMLPSYLASARSAAFKLCRKFMKGSWPIYSLLVLQYNTEVPCIMTFHGSKNWELVQILKTMPRPHKRQQNQNLKFPFSLYFKIWFTNSDFNFFFFSFPVLSNRLS